MKRLTFLFSIMIMLLASGVITQPAGAAVNLLGSWVTGTSHTKESGTDRALIFIAHAESTSTINLNSVTYGGQAMTKVVDYSYNAASGYAYAAAFILKETGVAAASSSTFSVTWGGTAPGAAGYSSVFLSNVDQTTATGATGTGGRTSNPVTTSALATASGDMVILGATCGNSGSYTLNNSFTEGTDQQIGGTVTGVTGRKSATGANETPSATYSSTINRQMIIGLVVKGTGGTTPTLSVSPTSVSVAAAAGSTGTFNITSNTSWTVSDDQTWLTASPTSGSNNAAVTVTAQENTGSARSATVTVSGTGVASQTVTVTQAAAGVSTAVWLEAECASVGSLWNKVSDSTASNSYYATIQSGNNSTGSAPTNSAGYIDFPFSITTSGTYYMFARVKCATANDDSFWVRMDGGSWVNWNNLTATSWTWKQFTNTFSLSTGSHTLTFAYREDGAQLDKINLATSSTLPTGTGSTASNLCTPGGTTLNVSPTSVSVAAAAGSTGTFNISSNTSWTVSDDQSWLTVSPTSGSNNAVVTVTAQENTGSARSATVTVSATGVPSQTVTVTQAAGGTTPTLSVSPTSINVAAAAGSTGTFNITSNTSWTVSDNQSWLTESPTSGSNNAMVTVTAQENEDTSARTATVTVSGTGVASQTVTVTQSGASGECTVPPMPSFSSLPTNAYLPDPFKFMDGTSVTTKAEWDCRRLEIAALIQEFESGYKPNTPYSATTATFSGSTLTVTVNDNGKTISFSCSISKPSGSGPFPMLITVGGSSLGSVSGQGVATINLPNDDIAAQASASSRGQGKFYTMYGSSHSASAMMAWAWGASRLIDAVEKTPSCGLDPTRIGVTGCSRNGKGALMCGAFDDRIDLTIPQESGSGGSASWRVSEYLHVDLGQNTQELCEIVGENVWFRANFNQFCGNEGKLPTDHHELIGLCAPRAIYIIDNNIDWLGEESSWNCANAAKKIWTALGVPDKFGYSGTGSHTHCAFPSSQQTELNAYIGKYLVGGGTGTTGIMRNDAGFTYDAARWVNWTTPTLQ